MAKKISSPLAPDAQELLQAINQLLSENDQAIRIPMDAINQGIAELINDSGKIVSRVSGAVVRQISKELTANENLIDPVPTAVLSAIGGYLQENELLLNHLASAAGLLQPGYPLEAALVEQVAKAPDLMVSTTLLMALREWTPAIESIAKTLKEIRDRLPPVAIRLKGESPDDEQGTDKPDDNAADADIEPDPWPDTSWLNGAQH